MLCRHCEAPIGEDSLYCPSCGKRVKRKSMIKKGYGWWWLMPLFVFLLMLGTAFGFVLYQQARTDSALKAFKKGEELALKGNYQQAYNAFNQATQKRKHFPNANLNKTIVTLGLSIEQDLDKVDSQNKKYNFAKSLSTLDDSDQKLLGYKGEVVTTLKKEISDKRVQTMVMQLRQEMKNKETIEELAPILNQAKALDVPEAKQIAGEILNQIVDITYNKASNLLKENQFTDALKAVKDGLVYDSDNKKLLDLQKTIQSAQDSFVSAEEERLQQAMAAAEKERQHNKNNAVKLEKVDAELNDYGDLIVTGTIKSDATVPISNVAISYKLVDKDGHEVDTNEIYATPDTIYPGNEATFEYTHMMMNQQLKVSVTGFKWYINN